MQLEQQVCSLELAKWLKELGVKQESTFSWCRGDDAATFGIGYSSVTAQAYVREFYSAFTVAELGEMLPDRYLDEIKRLVDRWFFPEEYDVLGNMQFTEADARAKMLIYLLENKLLTN